MQHKFIDIVEIDVLRALFDKFTKATGAATAILDLEGNVLVATGWQDICTQFHRVNPDTACRCLESDTRLAGQLASGQKYNAYSCRNGLVDVAVPIVVAGSHVGNLFTGQFLFSSPDEEYFKRQAAEFGFDEAAYLSALSRVPIFSKQEVQKIIDFLSELAATIGEMGATKLRLNAELIERKRAEEALRKQALVWEQMSEGVVVLDNDSLILDMNSAAEKMYGYSTDEMLGKRPSIWLKEDFVGKTAGEISEGIRRDGHWFGEVYIVRKDGSLGVTEVNVVPLCDENGNRIGRVSVNRDITERQQRIAEMQRFRKALDEVPAYIYMKDPQSRYIYANRLTLELFGCSGEELVGRDDTHFFPPDTVKQLREVDLRVFAGEQTFEEIDVYNAESGRRVYLEVKTPIYRETEQRTIWGLLGISTDITERKNLENKLLQAQKMETVGQLTGGVAHDFNNLLQVVETSLELAKETIQRGSEAEKFVNGALRAGHRGAKLTQQLLAFSRKQTLHPENLGARSLVDGMTALLSRTLGEDVLIKTKFADGTANVMVDENGLTNALLNLALNARAAMPKGGTLTVAVSKRHFDTDISVENEVLSAGDYIEIAVTDTGCGMSGENLSHAFEPFFTTKEVGEGSGLGLSMVYGFVRQSGGNVTIESELGKGTTVRLVLPVADGEVISTSDTQAARKDAQHAIKVLLVEDDPDVRASTVMLLQSLGCEVVEAEDAAPVIDILRRDKSIDLLLSDVVLPGGKNGIELAHEAVALRLDLKVILVSGYPEGTVEESGLKEAGFRLLGKPYSMGALSEALGSVMAQ